MSGVALIARDCNGKVIYHARDVFTRSSDRIIAELRCILWAVQTLRDLRVKNVVIASDCQAAIAALYNPSYWPQYRGLVNAIIITCQAKSFDYITFEVVSRHSNSIAGDIAFSVMRDGRFNGYLASGHGPSPAWLNDRILSEAQPRYVFRFLPY
ncbi:uncharacterized protein LOC17884643 [Capsella rubella]|uniref:uncharacterized protein LOC17884643 n=1 Tax=Capsella rubella TaxID=81985 RepID=UPI000CD59943|nr:uncharacterized protein LOC17884643 [Capsella rubella]